MGGSTAYDFSRTACGIRRSFHHGHEVGEPQHGEGLGQRLGQHFLKDESTMVRCRGQDETCAFAERSSEAAGQNALESLPSHRSLAAAVGSIGAPSQPRMPALPDAEVVEALGLEYAWERVA